DPHGHPIPTREGNLARRDLRPLNTFRAGQRVVIREVQDDSPERLRRWKDLGLMPGATVTFLRDEPLDGVYEIQVDGRPAVTLAPKAVAGLLGELLGPEKVTNSPKAGPRR